MGVAMPFSSSVMANEVKTSEFGVMSTAQMLAKQVGEVAGIQVLETVQQALEHRRDLVSANQVRRCSRRSSSPLSSARAWACSVCSRRRSFVTCRATRLYEVTDGPGSLGL